MFNTELCELLAIEHPIIQAGMGPFGTNRLAIAVENAGAPGFIADYNCRFARAPRSEHDAHRPQQPSDDLARVFSWQETNPVLSYGRRPLEVPPT